MVRTLLVVHPAESVERALLRGFIAPRRSSDLLLECAMHAFMRTVVLWLARTRTLQPNTQLEEPDRQTRESKDRAGGAERNAIVRADHIGQAVLAKRILERTTRGSCSGTL